MLLQVVCIECHAALEVLVKVRARTWRSSRSNQARLARNIPFRPKPQKQDNVYRINIIPSMRTDYFVQVTSAAGRCPTECRSNTGPCLRFRNGLKMGVASPWSRLSGVLD